MIVGASPGSAELSEYEWATVAFQGDCRKFATQTKEHQRLMREQTPTQQTMCRIIATLPERAKLLHDDQRRLVNDTLDQVADEFCQGIKSHFWINLLALM